jgi:hypothetical protein
MWGQNVIVRNFRKNILLNHTFEVLRNHTGLCYDVVTWVNHAPQGQDSVMNRPEVRPPLLHLTESSVLCDVTPVLCDVTPCPLKLKN